MFYINGLILHRDGFLNRYDMHSDTGATRRHHSCNMFKREEGHPFEKHGELRMTVHHFFVHIGVFCRTRNEERNPIFTILPFIGRARNRAVLCVFVAVVILEYSKVGEFVEKLVKFFVRFGVMFLVVPFHQQRIRSVFPYLHEFARNDVQEQVQ